jgi:hypothetical protein
VIVAPEFEALPAAGLEGFAGKRLQFRFLVFGEQTGAGLSAAGAQGPVVQIGELFRHGIELIQAEEGAVAQWREHPSLDLLHPIFRERFIPWPAHAGWDNADGDARLQIVRHQLGDRAAPGVEHPHMTAEPVFGGLSPRRFRVDDDGEWQRADEDADLAFAIGRRRRHGHAGVIDLAHLRRQKRPPHACEPTSSSAALTLMSAAASSPVRGPAAKLPSRVSYLTVPAALAPPAKAEGNVNRLRNGQTPESAFACARRTAP